MELNDYQKKAMATCMPSSENISYMLLNLMGEVGEFAEKLLAAPLPADLKLMVEAMANLGEDCSIMAKEIRKTDDHQLQHFFPALSSSQLSELRKESGDVEWQISGLERVMGWDKENVCLENLQKLRSRQQRGVIDGNGDNR